MGWFILFIILIIVWATLEILTVVDLCGPLWLKPLIFDLGTGGLMVIGAIEAVLIVWTISVRMRPLTPQREALVYRHCSMEPEEWSEKPVAEYATQLHTYAKLAASIYEMDPKPVIEIEGDIDEWLHLRDFPDTAAKQECLKVGLHCGIWVCQIQQIPVAAVVFRGTRPTRLNNWQSVKAFCQDWRSNFRWVFKWLPGSRDHYTVIGTDIFQRSLISSLKKWKHENNIERFDLVAVGHSLGGGLAQFMAYTFPESKEINHISVSKVYAFDSSPVSARCSAERGLCERNAEKLEIHHVFEHGEILAFVRLFLRTLLHTLHRKLVLKPLRKLFRKLLWEPENPVVYTYRFNFTKSINPLASHSMSDLAKALKDFRSMANPTQPDNSVRLEQLKMIYDYIKFHIGLYIGTPPVLVILAQGLGVERKPPFVAGIFDMVFLYLIAGMQAGWFMGNHVNRRWSSDFLNEFEASAFEPRRSFWHHWIYWSGLIVGLSGIWLSLYWKGSCSSP